MTGILNRFNFFEQTKKIKNEYENMKIPPRH